MKLIRSPFFKYATVLLVFGVWIFFFDDYSWSDQIELNTRLDSLQTQLHETQKKIKERDAESKTIENNLQLIEAIGRDNYYMKRDNEDVFIFLEEKEDGRLVAFE